MEIQNSSISGKGLFATRSYPKDSIIFVESPLISTESPPSSTLELQLFNFYPKATPLSLLLLRFLPFTSLMNERSTLIFNEEIEYLKTLSLFLSNFLKLESLQIFKILKFLKSVVIEDNGKLYYYEKTSYLNHCKNPNIILERNLRNIQFVSIRDIKEGEELTICYREDIEWL